MMQDYSINLRVLDLDSRAMMVIMKYVFFNCSKLIFYLHKAYAAYDKPLFNQTSTSIYRYRGDNNDSEVLGSTDADDLERSIKQERFGASRGFQGTEGGESSNGPVEFERETMGKPAAKSTDKDVFGLDTFLNKAKKGKRTRDDDDSDDDRRKK
jgi:SNW domain-containing protein 1